MRQTLEQWQSYLESLDPTKIELGLERVQKVFSELGAEISSEIIVVAGTNGKGSTVAALQALLLSAGKTVGSYVSPHLQKFNERICYQGMAATDDELTEAFEHVERARGATALTYFEFTTLAAIQLLSQKAPDYLVFEVGLGGRLDAVNVLDADIAIVTGVAMDHTDWLGNDLETIGYEKAGIYRADKPAIYASDNCPKTVLARISQLGAKPYLLGEQLSMVPVVGQKTNQEANQEINQEAGQALDEKVGDSSGSSSKLTVQIGGHTHCVELHRQSLPQTSLLAAVTAYALLGFELEDSISTVLSEVSVRGRYQFLFYDKTQCVLDVAHNAQAANYLAARLSKDKKLIEPVALVGTMSDKALKDILAPMVNVFSLWFLVRPNTPRAASLEQQRDVLIELGVSDDNIIDVGGITPANIKACLSKVKAAVIFGSFYTVGEFLDLVDLEKHS